MQPGSLKPYENFISSRSFAFGDIGRIKEDQNGIQFLLKDAREWSLVQSMMLKIVIERMRAVLELSLPNEQIIVDDAGRKKYVFRAKIIKFEGVTEREAFEQIAAGIRAKNGGQVVVDKLDDQQFIAESRKRIPNLDAEFTPNGLLAPEEQVVNAMLRDGLNIVLNFFAGAKFQQYKEMVKPLGFGKIMSKLSDLEGVKVERAVDVLNSQVASRSLYFVSKAYASALHARFPQELQNKNQLGWSPEKIARAVQLVPSPILN